MSRAMADGLLHDLRTLDARQDPAGANLAMRDAARLLDGLALHHLRDSTLEAHQDWLDGRVTHHPPSLVEFDGWNDPERGEREVARYKLAMAVLVGMVAGVMLCLGAAVAVGMSS